MVVAVGHGGNGPFVKAQNMFEAFAKPGEHRHLCRAGIAEDLAGADSAEECVYRSRMATAAGSPAGGTGRLVLFRQSVTSDSIVSGRSGAMAIWGAAISEGYDPRHCRV